MKFTLKDRYTVQDILGLLDEGHTVKITEQGNLVINDHPVMAFPAGKWHQPRNNRCYMKVFDPNGEYIVLPICQ